MNKEDKNRKYKESIRILEEELGKNKIILGLERTEKMLSELNNPEREYITIHVAGTNGKGSTCAMIHSILNEAGIRSGFYSSPHLIETTERIKIDKKDISKEDFSSLFYELLPLFRKHEATYFEALTVMAFQHFKRNCVKVGIIEVGLGGRLDATNVVRGEIGIITSISRDHEEYLGKTIEKITCEKAGIIKKGQYLITGEKSEIRKKIEKVCSEKGAVIIKKGIIEHYKRRLRDKEDSLSLKGKFQLSNAALGLSAIGILKDMGMKISEEAIMRGLKNTDWPGRMEHEENRILDCAHNPDAIITLIKEIKDFPKESRIILLGVLKDKNYTKMARHLYSSCSKLILVSLDTKRSASAEELKESLKKRLAEKDREEKEEDKDKEEKNRKEKEEEKDRIINKEKQDGADVFTAESMKEGLKIANNLIKENKERNMRIIITGSCYTVGEAKKEILRIQDTYQEEKKEEKTG